MVKALTIFRNLTEYLSKTKLDKDEKEGKFSAEDESNVSIPSALNAISFEFYPFF